MRRFTKTQMKKVWTVVEGFRFLPDNIKNCDRVMYEQVKEMLFNFFERAKQYDFHEEEQNEN